MNADVLIIGSGQAGGEVAAELRRLGFAGRIVMAGDEAHPPYHRPPLSKDVLSPDGMPNPPLIRSPEFYSDKLIDAWFGDAAVDVDLTSRTATLVSGRRIDFGKVVFATGARCRNLDVEGAHAAGVHTLRTFDDARRLRSDMIEHDDIVIVGGGFIGLEVAAAAQRLGKRTTVVEVGDSLLRRVATREVRELAHARLVESGAVVHLHEPVRRIFVSDDRVSGVELASTRIPADVVVVGIGITPNDELASAAGIECESGILVDATGATGNPNVFAAGDCTRVLPDEAGPPSPRGTVEHTEHLAKSVAARIIGDTPMPRRVPWAWSDQGDFLYQRAGYLQPSDQIVLRAQPNEKSLAKFHFRDGELAGIEAVNCPADARAVRAMLARGLYLSPTDAADPLRSLSPSTRSPRRTQWQIR
ncbi:MULTISPECIES: NAD(P)/FAD-dependent oxidoreductase [unclassified Mycolicibacterium]|uniref:NAD(P)/FAD-dependent oxidoreductase n=1 Tax=unclassified Mycolicibacterium TaxID=2636767 RepID=UPI002ED8D251